MSEQSLIKHYKAEEKIALKRLKGIRDSIKISKMIIRQRTKELNALKRNKKPLPKTINRPILIFYEVGAGDDRAYIVYPTGRVMAMDLYEEGTFKGGTSLAINNPGKGYAPALHSFKEREKDGWVLMHWDYL